MNIHEKLEAFLKSGNHYSAADNMIADVLAECMRLIGERLDEMDEQIESIKESLEGAHENIEKLDKSIYPSARFQTAEQKVANLAFNYSGGIDSFKRQVARRECQMAGCFDDAEEESNICGQCRAYGGC